MAIDICIRCGEEFEADAPEGEFPRICDLCLEQISEEVGYSSPNLAAIRRLPEKVRNNSTVYPSDADLKNVEFQTDVGAALSIYDQYWQRLKTGR